MPDTGNILPFAAPAGPRGAQCPRCFTFNLFRHAKPGTRTASSGKTITCALCGGEYAAAGTPARAA